MSNEMAGLILVLISLLLYFLAKVLDKNMSDFTYAVFATHLFCLCVGGFMLIGWAGEKIGMLFA